jgi:hypothetical protein
LTCGRSSSIELTSCVVEGESEKFLPEKYKPKGVLMLRRIINFSRFIGNYRYYRRIGADFKTAWNLASMTLP